MVLLSTQAAAGLGQFPSSKGDEQVGCQESEVGCLLLRLAERDEEKAEAIRRIGSELAVRAWVGITQGGGNCARILARVFPTIPHKISSGRFTMVRNVRFWPSLMLRCSCNGLPRRYVVIAKRFKRVQLPPPPVFARNAARAKTAAP